jgi:hypothetical protein
MELPSSAHSEGRAEGCGVEVEGTGIRPCPSSATASSTVPRDRTGAAGLAPKRLLAKPAGKPRPLLRRGLAAGEYPKMGPTKKSPQEAIMFYGASVGLIVLGIVFITQAETRLVGIFWLLAAAALAFAGWRRRTSAGKAATPEAKPHRPPRPGQ